MGRGACPRLSGLKFEIEIGHRFCGDLYCLARSDFNPIVAIFIQRFKRDIMARLIRFDKKARRKSIRGQRGGKSLLPSEQQAAKRR